MRAAGADVPLPGIASAGQGDKAVDGGAKGHGGASACVARQLSVRVVTPVRPWQGRAGSGEPLGLQTLQTDPISCPAAGTPLRACARPELREPGPPGQGACQHPAPWPPLPPAEHSIVKWGQEATAAGQRLHQGQDTGMGGACERQRAGQASRGATEASASGGVPGMTIAS